MVRRHVLISIFLLASLVEGKGAGRTLDWPTWRYDNARSSSYPEDLPSTLHLQWVHEAPYKPTEAWPGTAQSDWWRKRGTPEKKRVTFDQAYEVVGAGKRLYYGSSSDDQLHCLDLETGAELWSFYAEGPIRLAPTVIGKRVLFGSDDGHVYALASDTGKLLWKTELESMDTTRLPGNGRVISLYPVRTGVLVRGNSVSYCSGLFPKNAGAWHCGVDLRTGQSLARVAIEDSPQGYLEERDNKLYLATGRHPAGAILATLEPSGEAPASKGLPVSQVYPYAFVATPAQQLRGGDGVVAMLSEKGETVQWKGDVKGRAKALAIVQGKLIVSTDEGMIYCYGPKSVRSTKVVHSTEESVSTDVDLMIRILLSKLPHQKGYGLVLDAYQDQGVVAERLTVLSGMQVICRVAGERDAASLRARFKKRGLSSRAIVHVASDEAAFPYVPGMFNLVTTPGGLLGVGPWQGADCRELLRPGSGVAYFHGIASPSLSEPVLEGAGEWSHMYADAGNSACSNDVRVGSQVQLQWFGRPGPQHMVDRHLRTSAPLVKNGYMFVPGLNYLFGIDAWNGAILWERPIPDFQRVGALRDSGNLVASDEFLYCASADQCLILDTMTGRESLRIALSEEDSKESHEWGYLAVSGDHLVGSAVKKGSVYRTLAYNAIYEAGYGDQTTVTCSDRLFAVDRKTGGRTWSYQPKGSILNPSIALSSNEVFFVESHDAGSLTQTTGRLDYPLLLASKGASLVCLDLMTGQRRWAKEISFGENIQALFVLYREGKVVITVSRNAPGDAGKLSLHYETRVFDSAGGKLSWQDRKDFKKRPNLDHGEQDRHPAIVGNRLIVEPYIYDLATGEDRGLFQRPGGGCGTISASANSIYFRASHLASYDLTSGAHEKINRVSRPGCWINMIPAAGLLLVPEGSSGCICSYAIQGSMAFAPKREEP